MVKCLQEGFSSSKLFWYRATPNKQGTFLSRFFGLQPHLPTDPTHPKALLNDSLRPWPPGALFDHPHVFDHGGAAWSLSFNGLSLRGRGAVSVGCCTFGLVSNWGDPFQRPLPKEKQNNAWIIGCRNLLNEPNQPFDLESSILKQKIYHKTSRLFY